MVRKAQILSLSRGLQTISHEPEVVAELKRDCQQLRTEIEQVELNLMISTLKNYAITFQLKEECTQLPAIPDFGKEVSAKILLTM